MKHFVKVVSVLILLVYTVEGLIFAGLSAWGAVKCVLGIPKSGGGTIDGSPTPILDGFGRFLLGLGCVMLSIVIFMVVAEVFLLIRNYIKAIENRSFRYYRIMSVIAMISGAVNFIASLIMLLIIINIPYVFNAEAFLERFVFIVFLVNLFMEFWSLMNLLSSNQCIRDGL